MGSAPLMKKFPFLSSALNPFAKKKSDDSDMWCLDKDLLNKLLISRELVFFGKQLFKFFKRYLALFVENQYRLGPFQSNGQVHRNCFSLKLCFECGL